MSPSTFFSSAATSIMSGALVFGALALAAPQQAAAIVAVPDTYTTYVFTGNCQDCFIENAQPLGPVGASLPPQGVGVGELVLKNFTGGDFTAANFVSFTYNSIIFSYSSLAPNETATNVFGSIPGSLGGPGDLTLDFVNESTGIDTHFEAFSEIFGEEPEPFLSQAWCIAQSNNPIPSCAINSDFGFAYQLDAVVPEPATLALLGAGLLGLGMARRRRG